MPTETTVETPVGVWQNIERHETVKVTREMIFDEMIFDGARYPFDTPRFQVFALVQDSEWPLSYTMPVITMFEWLFQRGFVRAQLGPHQLETF